MLGEGYERGLIGLAPIPSSGSDPLQRGCNAMGNPWPLYLTRVSRLDKASPVLGKFLA